jgi:hypothetical protein
MDTQRKSTERGQVLVLVVLAFVALLGFTAIAVDGSMVYSDRRFAQNGADAASLAGGTAAALYLDNHGVTWDNWNCSSGSIAAKIASAAATARSTAISRANDNGFVIDQDISDKHGVVTQCGVDNSGTWPDKYMDIRVLITHDTNTAFAHFVYGGILRNSVEAVTRIRPRSPLAYGFAIVALNEAQCSGQSNGAGFHGTNFVKVHGGGIWSNGCLRGDGDADVYVYDAGIFYQYKRSTDNFNEFRNQTPQAHNTPLPQSSYEIDPPDCSAAGAHNMTANQFENDATDASGLAPGLYCVTGDIKFNAGDIVKGTGVTIVIQNGSMTMNGGATIKLYAPTGSGVEPAVAGLLFYAPPSNHNTIQLNGNSDSRFTGTVLATGANINMTGTENNESYKTQIIGYNVEVGGTADTDVTYDSSLLASRPSALDLYR